MKKKILLSDTVLERFVSTYSKDFSVDTLWNSKKIKFSEYEGLVVSGLFQIPPLFYKKLS